MRTMTGVLAVLVATASLAACHGSADRTTDAAALSEQTPEPADEATPPERSAPESATPPIPPEDTPPDAGPPDTRPDPSGQPPPDGTPPDSPPPPTGVAIG